MSPGYAPPPQMLLLSVTPAPALKAAIKMCTMAEASRLSPVLKPHSGKTQFEAVSLTIEGVQIASEGYMESPLSKHPTLCSQLLTQGGQYIPRPTLF